MQGVIANVTSVVRIKTVKVTDQRVGLMSEILNSIRLIKMYAWEDSFANKIAGKYGEHTKLRREVFECIGKISYL
jgi:hypothetical protein